MTLYIFNIIMALLLALPTHNDIYCNTVALPDDSIAIERMLTAAEALGDGECRQLFFARQFLGRPYVAHTLEIADPEQLVVNTRQLDCTTLVENVTALTLCSRRHLTSYHDFLKMLVSLRYRHGKLDGYVSRLHYFSEWIDDNSSKGLVREQQEPNPPFKAVQTIRLGFMGANPDKYEILSKHPEFLDDIRLQEQAMTGRKVKYIPKSMVSNLDAMRKAVDDGDIIAITCNNTGLDIAHVGFAVRRSDGVHLLHASSVHKKVVEEKSTLSDYLNRRKSFTGVRIIKMN